MGNIALTWSDLMRCPDTAPYSQTELATITDLMMLPKVVEEFEIEMGLKWLGVGPAEVADLMKQGKYVYSSKKAFFAWLVIKRSKKQGGWLSRRIVSYDMWACELDGKAFQFMGTQDDLKGAFIGNILACRKPELGGLYEFASA